MASIVRKNFRPNYNDQLSKYLRFYYCRLKGLIIYIKVMQPNHVILNSKNKQERMI